MKSQRSEERLEDWVAETDESIAARLEGVKAAQAQTRLTLGTTAIISVMMLIGSYNAYQSYDYDWIVKRNCPPAILLNRPADKDERKLANLPNEGDDEFVRKIKDRVDKLTEHSMREWASSRTVLISLLGIRVSVDDASVLGTAVLFVLSLWLFLVARRENHTTGFLLRDTDSPRPAEGGQGLPGAAPAEGKPRAYSNSERWLIYHTIISNSLFVTFDRLPNVDSLDGPNSLEAAVAEDKRGRLKRWWLNVARNFFFWFPVVVAAIVCLYDRYSYFGSDPFAFGCEPDGATPFFWKSTAIIIACLIPLVICCWKSSRLSNHTESVLREYGINLHSDLLEQKRRSQS